MPPRTPPNLVPSANVRALVEALRQPPPANNDAGEVTVVYPSQQRDGHVEQVERTFAKPGAQEPRRATPRRRRA